MFPKPKVSSSSSVRRTMFIDPELAPGPPSVRRAMSIEPA